MEPLLNTFMTFGTHLDPSEDSYYSNITGFIRGDIMFHNITSLPLDNNDNTKPAWIPHAQTLMSNLNTSEVIERASTWNWTGCDKVAMSVVEKAPKPSGDRSLGRGLGNLTEEMTVVHVRIAFWSC